MRFLFAIVFAVLLSSCALPTPPPSSFVSDQELMAAELSQQAMEEYQNGRFIDAELKYRQLLFIFPESETALFNLANVLVAQGMYRDAEQYLKELEALHLDDPKFKKAKAKLYFDGGYYNQAIDAYQQLLVFAKDKKLDALAADALRSLSLIYFRLGELQKALCFSSDSLALRSSREDLLRHARLLIALDRITEAELFLAEYFKQKEHQKDAYALHIFSLLCFAEGRYDEAVLFNKRAGIFRQGNPDLEFEIKLVKAMLFDKSEVLRKEYDDEDEDLKEEKEEERQRTRQELLSDRRLDRNATLYWPAAFVSYVLEQRELYELEKAEKEKDGFFSKGFSAIEQILPW